MRPAPGAVSSGASGAGYGPLAGGDEEDVAAGVERASASAAELRALRAPEPEPEPEPRVEKSSADECRELMLIVLATTLVLALLYLPVWINGALGAPCTCAYAPGATAGNLSSSLAVANESTRERCCVACSASTNCSASTFLANATVGAGGEWARAAENLTASPFDGCWWDGAGATTEEPSWGGTRLSDNGECDEGSEGFGVCPWGSDAADCGGACFLHAADTLNHTETPDAVACLQPVQVASESRAWLENLIGSGTIWLRGALAMKVFLPMVLQFL